MSSFGSLDVVHNPLEFRIPLRFRSRTPESVIDTGIKNRVTKPVTFWMFRAIQRTLQYAKRTTRNTPLLCHRNELIVRKMEGMHTPLAYVASRENSGIDDLVSVS